MATFTEKYGGEVLTEVCVDENEVSQALMQSIERGLRDLEEGRKISNEEVQRGARALIQRWKEQLMN